MNFFLRLNITNNFIPIYMKYLPLKIFKNNLKYFFNLMFSDNEKSCNICLHLYCNKFYRLMFMKIANSYISCHYISQENVAFITSLYANKNINMEELELSKVFEIIILIIIRKIRIISYVERLMQSYAFPSLDGVISCFYIR